MSGSPPKGPATKGMYLDLGQLWVRYDLIGTIKPTEEGEPHCLVVLTLPGYKTLRVGCTAEELLAAIDLRRQSHEQNVGIDRAKGMRWATPPGSQQ